MSAGFWFGGPGMEHLESLIRASVAPEDGKRLVF